MKTRPAASAFALLASGAVAQDLETTIPSSVGAVAPALQNHLNEDIFDGVWNDEALSMRDRALVTFAALMTRHEVNNIESHVALALDAGVTPGEISETITHLAFYTGMGNAIAAAEATAPVFEARGITADDLPPVDPELLPLNEEAEAARESNVQSNYSIASL